MRYVGIDFFISCTPLYYTNIGYYRYINVGSHIVTLDGMCSFSFDNITERDILWRWCNIVDYNYLTVVYLLRVR
jgi:hypothetical protein